MAEIEIISHSSHRLIVMQELERLQADAEVMGLLLAGSVARGDAAPSSDVDLCVLLRKGCSRSFEAETISGILVERKYADLTSSIKRIKSNPMEVYAYLDGRILFDLECGLIRLTAFARKRLEGYRMPEEERRAISHWLRSAAIKIAAAQEAGNDLKAAFVATSTAWKVLEGIWAVNDKPMPPSGCVISHLKDLNFPTTSDPSWFMRLLQGETPTRVTTTLALINELVPRLSEPVTEPQ
jgi:predicted nucleotidyltransferase